MDLSMDLSGVFSQAGDIFNALFPIMALPLGITLGIGLVGWIFNAIASKFKFGGK